MHFVKTASCSILTYIPHCSLTTFINDSILPRLFSVISSQLSHTYNFIPLYST